MCKAPKIREGAGLAGAFSFDGLLLIWLIWGPVLHQELRRSG